MASGSGAISIVETSRRRQSSPREPRADHVRDQRRATIENNVVWENGWGFGRGWGRDLDQLVDRCHRPRNLLAWNADGISVISQIRNRPGGDGVRNVSVADNTVLSMRLLAYARLAAGLAGAMYTPDSAMSGPATASGTSRPSHPAAGSNGLPARTHAASGNARRGGSEYLSDEVVMPPHRGRHPVHLVPHRSGSRRGPHGAAWSAERTVGLA
jgi:hypothetical protein